MSYVSLPTTRDSTERRAAAAPPLYLLVIVLIPIGAAIYIASTRYTDGKHAGFDVLFGSLEGIICSWFAFRWYHLPIRRGAGWAWGPRHRNVAFGAGLGINSYGTRAHSKGQDQQPDTERSHAAREDVELRNIEPVVTSEGSYESQRALM